MADRETLSLEFDPQDMWVLSEDRKALTLNVTIPAVAGLSEPLTINIDFDCESARAMVLRLRTLSMRMLS